MLKRANDADTPVVWWQLVVTPKCLVREVALRVLCAKAAALGCERLWSFARATLTDNRRSMESRRLMELMQVKMNSHLLEDEEKESVMQELHALLHTSEGVADIYEELQAIEEEEEVAQRVQHGTSLATEVNEVEDDTSTEQAEAQVEETVDLFDV
jgi:hypothetical protein